jgi:excisionase family DNA binding protein
VAEPDTGVSRERVKALIREGRLPAQKVGTQWALRTQDVAAYKPLPAHRPKKTNVNPDH